jgi:hypothetical protein
MHQLAFILPLPGFKSDINGATMYQPRHEWRNNKQNDDQYEGDAGIHFGSSP